MTERSVHELAVLSQFALAACTCLGLLFVAAPYGRYRRKGWGPNIPNVTGWICMEAPAVLVFTLTFLAGDHAVEIVPVVFLAIWHIHYINRAFIFPLRTRWGNTKIPLFLPVLGILFNSLNAYINARWISHLGRYGPEWLTDPRFLVGCAIFAAGWLGNLHSDAILRKLRSSEDRTYKIPIGGLFRWISAPNYACEIVEWTGWAIATWSPAGLAFAVYTAANLGPRGHKHHAWYRKTFQNYPRSRKALIPKIF